jgi:ribosomal protein S18 acetylase RimI-like enzyme
LSLTVDVAGEATPELVDAFARLIPQLSRSSPAPDAASIADMISAPGTWVLVARDGDGTIVGTLTLVVFRIPTALRAWIEDVVVDESARGNGVEACRIAGAAGAKTVDLTSRPSRDAANRLYQRLGFQLRETNVYRFFMP